MREQNIKPEEIDVLEEVLSDSDEAVRWFRRAAELGVSGSMYLLGECLLAGEARARCTRDET